MPTTLSVAFGALVGIVGSLPVVYMLGLGLRSDARATVANGLAAVLFSFVASSALLLVARTVTADGFVACALGFVTSLVCLWSIGSVRAWRHANGQNVAGDRKRGTHGRH